MYVCIKNEKPSKKIAQSPQMQIFKFMQKGRRYFARDSTIFCQSIVTKAFVKIEGKKVAFKALAK